MKIFYATFCSGGLLGDHIIRIIANEEWEAREQLHRSRLLTNCIAFIYDEAKGLELIEKFGYTVIEGRIGA